MLWIAAPAFAADPPNQRGPLPLSLKRAVEIATSAEGNTNVQLAGEALKQTRERSLETRAALLPNVDGAVTWQDMTRNLAAVGISFTTPIPGFQIPTFVGPFHTLDARLTGTQSVFDFSSIRRYQASKAGVSAATSDVDNTEEQVAGQVARAYLAGVRADADVESAEANVNLSQALLTQAENQKKAGTGTGMEITRAKVQLANDQQRLLDAQNNRRSAYLRLLRVMGMRLDTDLQLTDPLRFVPVDEVTLEQARTEALKQRPDYAAQQEREDNARLSASASKMQRLPSVLAFGDYGPIGTGPDSLLPTRTVGISIRVPIFDGGKRDARRAESASQYRAEQVRTRDLKEQIELDVRLALDELHSAEEQVKVARDGLVLANERDDAGAPPLRCGGGDSAGGDGRADAAGQGAGQPDGGAVQVQPGAHGPGAGHGEDQEHGAVMKKRIVPIVVVLAVAAAAFYFYRSLSRKPDTRIMVSGNIELNEVNIAFKTAGKLIERTVDEGDTVRKGQMIARLDRDQLVAQRERESASLDGRNRSLPRPGPPCRCRERPWRAIWSSGARTCRPTKRGWRSWRTARARRRSPGSQGRGGQRAGRGGPGQEGLGPRAGAL